MIIKSPYPNVEIPDVSLPQFILSKMAEFGDRTAIIDGPTGRKYTYATLAALIRQVAAGLQERGLKKGDVVAIHSPNLPEYPIAFHAVALAGGIVTPVNPLYTVDELAFQLRDAGAKFLITIPHFMQVAQAAAQREGVKEVFVFGEAEGATPFTALVRPDLKLQDVQIDPANDLVTLPYSSGTTGLPKGVMLTHRNLVSNIAQTLGIPKFDVPHEGDVALLVLPFYHIYGLTVLMNAGLCLGGTGVTVPRFDLEQFLGLIQEHKVTHINLVPPILVALAKHPLVDKYDLSSLRSLTSGAAPLGAALAGAVMQRVGANVSQGYGMTETSPVTHTLPTDTQDLDRSSIGPLIPNTEARIVDLQTGQDVPQGEAGELWIRGPQVMKGYLNRPDATASTLDADGWLHTGDIATVDGRGFFRIVDRAKELIKYKGYQVAPAELEAILLSHPAVADAAVVPYANEEAGEIPKAYVVLKGETTADDIMTFVAEKVSPHKKIRVIEFTDAIPKSPAGKILRRVLVDRDRERAAQA